MLDSTLIRAHHHAARMNGGDDDENLGRSRGGFGTKVPLRVESLGLPLEIALSPGRDAGVTYAPALLGDREPEAVLGGEGYDSDALAVEVEARGAAAVAPPRSSRKTRGYDVVLYKGRNKVVRCIDWLKQFRWVASRFEMTLRNFLGVVLLAAVTLWLE